MWRPAILQRAEAALLDEKAAKLKGLAQVLDDQLGESFDALLTFAGYPDNVEPERRRAALTAALQPLADRLTTAFQGVGLGYYDAKLDRIIAYAPSGQLGYLVGVVPAPDHLGRQAMEQRSVRIAIGSMVRGDAMNCMHPLIRRGEVIGFAFANESVEDIYRQIQSGASRSGQSNGLPATLGLSSLAVFAGTSALSAESIRAQLGEAAASGLVDQASVLPLMGALDQVERYVRLFLNNLGAGLLIVDANGRVLFGNEEMHRLCGAVRPTLHDREWANVRTALGLEVAPGEQLDEGKTDDHLVRGTITTRDGPLAVEVLAAALPGLPGHRLYLFDPADRAGRQGDYFERAERLALAGELSTAIAHEIRNPLTVVAGSIQLIPDRVDDQEFLLSLSHIAGKELARVNRIIQGLLGFARFAEPERTLLDLGELALEALEFLDWYARKSGVKLVAELASGPLLVYGDGEHLKQALLNLMMNAIQAMADHGGMLTLRTAHPTGNRSVQLSIADTGPGMSQETLAKIWEVFYSSKQGGTGLGLPVVQRIIDAHRGYIEVDSTPGVGTCFTVLLPLANRPYHPREEEPYDDAPAARRG
jgi:two-component system, NtrC family, sensor histidine kinase AtoS